ncbi:MAG: hypothetical protein OXQ89_07270 [Rhodospirillaceae bacterium]|nr:hypothetical protein [Rhodospirillaceae bacterium]
MRHALITLLATLLVAHPVLAQTDDEFIARAMADGHATTVWTKTDTGVISIVAAVVLAATAFDYSSCGQGFKAEDHPTHGAHCMLTLDDGRISTYNTKVPLRGGCDADGKCAEIGRRMLCGSLGLAMLGAWLIRTDDDNAVTRNLETGVGPGGAVVTNSVSL